ncbi:MAG: hypothetical protein HQK87_03100 [Nitrospinae bacterium]|nr:hypothetical protein [Nitrospinota bacterium]
MKPTHPGLLTLAMTALLATGCVEEMRIVSDDAASSPPSAARLYKPAPDEVIEDPSTGLQIAKEIIYLTFRKQTSKHTAEEIIGSVKGAIVGSDEAAQLYQVRFAGLDLAAIDAIRMKLLADHPEVQVASRLPVSVTKDPYYVR